ncbi:HPr kinase/phosphorylase (HPrK/P) [Alteracholeplasma palmae J233]|uniref:HPr kinase/phosphorylase n=1 Tax=Alteracholeplasma palmae (strain ATCC 49389 / J233) TaxID=1318466 RepID=U4KQY6_ALTPJ|nr:HPr(Ser) kinase/phosphatase [Alteracholeplasma palmae]CCV63711.1 HPr kinase/phosphorylase (HPrK/P) [Alteracholeplasma palmae J233]
MENSISIKKLASDLELEVIAGSTGLKRRVKAEMLNRPGVELAGFYDFYDQERILLIGSKEASFLKLFSPHIQKERVDRIVSEQPPAIVFSTNVEITQDFIDAANLYEVPILKSSLRTTPLNSRLYSYLHSGLAPRMSVHGVLVDIHGLGTLIIGKSGIGKSETALELIKRGHILISDDRVDIFETSPGVIIGNAPKILERYIEIRGIGIVDIVSMFGAGSYRENKKIRLVVELEHWKKDKVYDRLGIETETTKFFNTEIPKIIIPILPGRNTATLVESAAMNQKLKYLGHNAALELTEAVAKAAMQKEEDDEE